MADSDDLTHVLQMIDGGRRERVTVIDDGDEHSPVIDSTVDALRRFGEVFTFGDRTVVVAVTESAILKDGTGWDAPFLKRLTPVPADLTNLIAPMERAIEWHGPVGQGRNRTIQRKRMEHWIIKAIATLGPTGNLPILSGVVDHPVWWNGNLVAGHVGYHPPTRLYIHSTLLDIDPDMYSSPQDAFNFLAEDWMMEARFNTPEDMIRALTLPMTLIKRPTSIRRGCPTNVFTAPEPNSGKTTTAEALHMAVTGGLPGVTEYPADKQEFQKSYAAALLESPSMILFDNLENGWHWRNSTLDKAATSDTMKLRVLGKTKEIEVSTLPVIVVTGNALQPGSADSMSRSLWSTFDGPRPGRVYERDLIAFTAEHRAEILSAYVKIAQGDISGAEIIKGGRFPDWEREVAAPMMVASRTGAQVYDLWHENQFLTSLDEAAADLIEAMQDHQQKIAAAVADDGLTRKMTNEAKLVRDERIRINTSGYMPGDIAMHFQEHLRVLMVARGKRQESDDSDVTARLVNDLLSPLIGRRFGGAILTRKDGKKPNGRPLKTYWVSRL